MESGGVSKSLSNLLNIIDLQRYEVDCFILSPKGIFMPTIPDSVHLIKDKKTAILCDNFPQNILNLTKNGYLLDALIRLFVGFFMLFNKGLGAWLISRRIYQIDKNYDLAVDYNGQQQLYYLIDKVKAKKKVSFFHSDYAQWNYYYKMDKRYYPRVDRIFTISEKCVQSLKRYFPDCSNKIELFKNISSIELINKLAERELSSMDYSSLKLATIGHLSTNKGTDLAIQSALILKQKGIPFRWYFIGRNQNPALFKKMISDNSLNDEIVFLGLVSNPYPYIKQADIVVHPSRFEGKSIALDEAKILCKPIVVTNFSTVNDQFKDCVNASISTMKPEDLAERIIELAKNDELRNRYISYLSQHQKDNKSEIEKIYQLL